jgi:hypothetical protein
VTALVVGTYVALCWLLLWAIKSMRLERREHRERSSWLAQYERDLAARRRQREIDESKRIGWRK